ncbi:MAG: OmpH family outer membrane protein [Magnetospirillum sp.]|nr:MAG: OmpH family outer membrane protein [Magnetospirillum sp.]
MAFGRIPARAFALALLAGLSGGDGALAQASKIPVPVVIVVDHQAAMQQTAAGKAIAAQNDQWRKTFETDFEARSKALKVEEAELVRQKPVMSQELWQQKARAFEQGVMEFNQNYQRARQAVEKSYRQALSTLGAAFEQEIRAVATELGANLVLPKQQTHLYDPRMDVTALVIERLNKRLPSIDFPPPQVEGGSGGKAQPAPRKGK